MRIIAVLAILLAACSSDDDDPECSVDGTYTATGAVESGNCGGGGEPVTDTFTTLPSGEVKLEIQGLPNMVPVGTMNGCTWTAAASFVVKDAIGPETQGTAQYSYTFTKTGFSGIVSISIPNSVSLPGGCYGTSKITGVRR